MPLSAVAKEKAEDEAQAIAFDLKEAKEQIEADELMRIDFEFKFNEQEKEISRLKSRLEAQNKKFYEDIRGVCDARIKLEETVKSRQERIEFLENEIS